MSGSMSWCGNDLNSINFFFWRVWIYFFRFFCPYKP